MAVEERALHHYQAMVLLNPKDPKSFIKLGDALCLQEKYTNVIVAFEKAVKLNPDDYLVYYHLGNAHYMLSDYEKAVKNYRESLVIDNTNSQVHFNIGSALSALKLFYEAQKHYMQAICLKENNTPAYLCLAEVYIELGKLKKAAEAFGQILAYDPVNEKACEGLESIKLAIPLVGGGGSLSRRSTEKEDKNILDVCLADGVAE